jgi:hypothetical protein
MKPIKLYFAGEWGPRKEQGDLDIVNRLVSYLYPKQLDKWLELTGNKPGNIILDSGAFSAWNKGTSVNIYEYIDFVHKAQEKCTAHNKRLFVVNLDVIPGNVGETKGLNRIIGDRTLLKQNKEIIDLAAKNGFMNLKLMKQEGITPIHVFHQGEDIKWLNRMLKYTDYIGISPANDMPNDSKKKWMYQTFDYLYKNNIEVDTHGFAVMIPDILRELPWTSCDAISWLMIAATGCIIYPIGGFKNQVSIKVPKPYNQILVSSKKVGKGMQAMSEQVLKLLERDGYTYEQIQDYKIREEINVRTFHYFEQWINQYKAGTEFIPYSNKIKKLF